MNAMRRESIMTVVSTLAMLIAFGLGLVRPRVQTLQVSQQACLDVVRRNDELVVELAEIPILSQQVSELRNEIFSAQERVPLQDHTATFEYELKDLGRKLGVLDSAEPYGNPYLRFAQVKKNDRIYTQGLTIYFVADFPTFYKFLDDLENNEKLISVDQIFLEPLPQQVNRFLVRLDLSIFYGQL